VTGDHSPDDAERSVRVAAFDALIDALRSWCEAGGGEFRLETVDRAVCEFDRATFAVTREGRVDAGMPLHEFEGRADRLVFAGDPASADAVRVVGPDVAYVYRRP